MSKYPSEDKERLKKIAPLIQKKFKKWQWEMQHQSSLYYGYKVEPPQEKNFLLGSWNNFELFVYIHNNRLQMSFYSNDDLEVSVEKWYDLTEQFEEITGDFIQKIKPVLLKQLELTISRAEHYQKLLISL